MVGAEEIEMKLTDKDPGLFFAEASAIIDRAKSAFPDDTELRWFTGLNGITAIFNCSKVLSSWKRSAEDSMLEIKTGEREAGVLCGVPVYFTPSNCYNHRLTLAGSFPDSDGHFGPIESIHVGDPRFSGYVMRETHESVTREEKE